MASASSSEDTSVTSSEVESLKEQIAEFQKKVASGDNDDEVVRLSGSFSSSVCFLFGSRCSGNV